MYDAAAASHPLLSCLGADNGESSANGGGCLEVDPAAAAGGQ